MARTRVLKDQDAALSLLKKDTRFRALIKKHGEAHLARHTMKAQGVFPALLRSIIYQQLSGKAAGAIHTRVLALFPQEKVTPEALLKIRTLALRKAGLSAQKVEYVRDLARRCLDGTIEEKRFSKMTSEEIIEHLIAVKGIGRWSAQMYLMFSLERPDILPHDDLGVRKGLMKVYGLKTLPSKKDMDALAAPWRAYASYASWYLWRSLDAK